MLLVGRLWDAFFDPMMGVLADRTNTRWGKFRPWVLWTAVPWAVVMVLAYTVPGFGHAGTIAWVAFTNIALMTLYSANNTPYSALSGVMTGDSNERTSLSSYRFVAAMLAQLIVGGFTLPLVAKFGHGEQRGRAGSMTMTLWAVICVVCFVITFATTRERIQPPPQQKSDARADFKNLLAQRAVDRDVRAHARALRLRGDARRHDVLLLQLLRRPGAARSSSSSASACRRRRPRSPTAATT